jgi:trk system potassium uptake protein TrkH
MKASPTQVLVVSYITVILIGSIILRMPISSSNGKPIPYIDALFTATSATCVTGLTVKDTGNDFSLFGQIVIVLLIQIGGIGYLTLANLLNIFLVKRTSIFDKLVIKESFQVFSIENIDQFIIRIIKFTLLFELMGCALLALKFIPKMGYSKGLFYSLFHSISAFCNAGFSLFPKSFEDYKGSLLVVGTLSILIICGGIGFIVWNDVYETIIKRNKKNLHLHTKIALSTTAVLIPVGFLLILSFEILNPLTMKFLTWKEKILVALFQSITPRTAGFNTIPIGNMNNYTLLLIIIFMFIGASPGGTGGGIKTSTFTTLILTSKAYAQKRREVNLFNRCIPQEISIKAFAIFFIALSILTISIISLLITEKGDLLKITFEAFSAFGTVGLSMGNKINNLSLCSTFSPLGKIILIALMYIGRVGVLLLATLILPPKEESVKYIEEPIAIG